MITWRSVVVALMGGLLSSLLADAYGFVEGTLVAFLVVVGAYALGMAEAREIAMQWLSKNERA